jgi:ankyrin repeat protein
MFHAACSSASIKSVKYLLQKGFKINEKNNMGNISLHYIIESTNKEDEKELTGRIKLIDYLLKRNTDINSKNNKGMTPLDLLLNKNFENINIQKRLAKYLIDNGANIIKGNKKDILYHVISSNVDLDVSLDLAISLVKKGIDINKKDNDGNTLLHHLALKVNNEDSFGYSESNKNEIKAFEKYMPELIRLGLKINIINKKGQTAMDILNSDSYDARDLFKKYGAKESYELDK